MSRLTRDETAEPVSRDHDQILRREGGQGKTVFFPYQLTKSRIDHTRLIHTLLKELTIHTYIQTTYINTYIHTYIHFCRV